jgi:hypothetical protein
VRWQAGGGGGNWQVEALWEGKRLRQVHHVTSPTPQPGRLPRRPEVVIYMNLHERTRRVSGDIVPTYTSATTSCYAFAGCGRRAGEAVLARARPSPVIQFSPW